MAIADADGTVRVSGAEILSRIVRDGADQPIGEKAQNIAAAASARRRPSGGSGGSEWVCKQG